jgi:hypothetical protein
VPTGRTGAKLIRLAGVTDVGQAAAAALKADAAAAAALKAAAAAGMTGQATSSIRDAAAGAQDDCNVHHPQQLEPEQQQQQQQRPVVPLASDVEPGAQLLGALRRKPGKGDPTLSLSCSDKIARWACLGLQGAVLSVCLAEPLYLNLLVLSAPPSEPEHSTGTAGAQSNAAAAASAVTTAADASSSRGDSEEAQQLPPVRCTLLAAVSAAGRRAVQGRVSSCAQLKLPAPFKVQPPVVWAVGPAEPSLGLASSNVRKSAQGEAQD